MAIIERPILYSEPMVLAKLAGRKTQTRRIIKDSFNGCLTDGGPHPCPNDPVLFYPGEVFESPVEPGELITIDYPEVRANFFCSTMDKEVKCPFGKPGDILYGSETWRYHYHFDSKSPKQIISHDLVNSFVYEADGCIPGWAGKARPSIHMPKSASRIWERVTAIRAERLHQITEEDAIAEGVVWSDAYQAFHVPGVEHPNKNFPYLARATAREMYAALWDTINGSGAWLRDYDSWVWVVTTEILSTTGRPKDL